MKPPAGTWPRVALLGALAAFIALIGALDYWTGTEVDLSIFYLIPIAAAAWLIGLWTSYALATLSTIAWLLADLYGGFAYSSWTIPYWNASVGFALFLIIATMLSARKRTEQRVLELMAVKSEFTSMVSHEVRTPLTCIKEGLDIVLDLSSGPLNQRQAAHLHTAKRNVDRLTRLLNDVLTYQKLDARRMQFFPRPCDINRLAAQAVEEFALPAQNKRLRLMTEFADGLPPVTCDPDRISQVFSNLLSNALKFSEQGQVCVKTELSADGVRVAIQDQGRGIPSEDCPKLFQYFTQLSPQVGKRTEGTGLGLAITRQIIELHGGTLGVESRPGAGSTFHFTLPIRDLAPRQRPAPKVHEHSA